jgi:hypothetical protein
MDLETEMGRVPVPPPVITATSPSTRKMDSAESLDLSIAAPPIVPILSSFFVLLGACSVRLCQLNDFLRRTLNLGQMSSYSDIMGVRSPGS